MSADEQDILLGVLVPFAAAGVVFGLSLGRGANGQHALPRAAAALAAGLGFFAAYSLMPWMMLTPEESWHWLPYLILGGMVSGVIGVRLPWRVRAGLACGLAVTTAHLLVPDFEELQPWRLHWQMALGGSIIVMWLLTDFAMARRPDVRWGACWLLTLLAVAVEMKFAFIGTFAQLAGMLASTLLVLAVAECKPSWRGAVWSVAPILAVAVPGLLFLCKFSSTSETPLSSYFLLLFAPVGFCLCQMLPARLGRWRSLLAYALLLVCLGWGLYQSGSVSDFTPM